MPYRNCENLDRLLNENSIRMRPSAFLAEPPSPLSRASFDRFEGMMLGLAIGDALGNTSESLVPAERERRHGEIRDYLLHRVLADRRGYPSDDTQLAFRTLEQILDDGHLAPDRLMRRFQNDRIFGIGGTVRAALHNANLGVPWDRCGVARAGNGALMRIAPVLFPYLANPSRELWADTALATMITHNDSMAIASSLAMVHALWQCLHHDRPPEPEWWLETFIAVLREFEVDDQYTSRSPHLPPFQGTLWQFLDRYVRRAYRDGEATRIAMDTWYSGAYLLETVSSVTLLLMRYAGNLEEAIVRAVNDTHDNDSIAAIVGAAAGALHGKSAIPPRWLEGLSGRTRENDDGHIFRLLDRARQVSGQPSP